MKTRFFVLLLALSVVLSCFCILAAAEDFDPSQMTWSAYQALSAAEKTAFFKCFPNAAAFNAWRQQAQEAEKPESTVIGSGGDLSVLPAHLHCVCGGACTTGGHVHGESVTWKPIVQSNLSELTRAFSDGLEHYFYLVESVTVQDCIPVGQTAASGVHLDLNGQTLTCTAQSLFSVYGGSVSLCNCKAEGGIVLGASAASYGGSFVSWEQPAMAASEFCLYSGTVSYAPNAAPAANGMIYCTSSGTVRIYGGTLNGNGRAAAVGGGLITCDATAAELFVYAGTLQNGYSAVAGGAIRCDTALTLDSLAAVFYNNYAPIGENVSRSLSEGGTLEVFGQTMPAGTEIDLCGGTLCITGGTVLDLTVLSSVDCGTIVFDDTIAEDDMRSIVSAIAEKNLNLPVAQRCIPIRSGDRTYTVCKLHPAGGLWCPSIQQNANSQNSYKFRIMPRFVSQTAYDLLSAAQPEDRIAIGFTISAKRGEEPIYILHNGEQKTQISCDFSDDNCKSFFSALKDTQVFYINVTGIDEGCKVTLQPYIKVGGQIVYQGLDGSECAVLDLTGG